MRNTLIIGVLCVLVLTVGIFLYFKNPFTHPQTPTEVTAHTEAPEQKEVSFKILDSGTNATEMTERKNYAIYEAGKFATFWKEAHGSTGKAVPAVDFTKNYVIAVFAGTQPSGGYSISVSHITDVGTARSVAVTIEEPDASCTVIEEQTSPYQFVVVPITEAESLAHTDIVTKKACATP